MSQSLCSQLPSTQFEPFNNIAQTEQTSFGDPRKVASNAPPASIPGRGYYGQNGTNQQWPAGQPGISQDLYALLSSTKHEHLDNHLHPLQEDFGVSAIIDGGLAGPPTLEYAQRNQIEDYTSWSQDVHSLLPAAQDMQSTCRDLSGPEIMFGGVESSFQNPVQHGQTGTDQYWPQGRTEILQNSHSPASTVQSRQQDVPNQLVRRQPKRPQG